jgi:hypothetical protein
VLERVTHNSSGKIIDRYTHFDWAPLCEAVLCLRLDVHRDPQLTSGNPEESGSAPSGTGGQLPANTAESGHSQPGSIPRASTTPPTKNSHSKKPRQEKRQDLDAYRAELSATNATRKRRLLALQQVDPDAAAPGLAVCRALDAAYQGDAETAESVLAAEAKRGAG